MNFCVMSGAAFLIIWDCLVKRVCKLGLFSAYIWTYFFYCLIGWQVPVQCLWGHACLIACQFRPLSFFEMLVIRLFELYYAHVQLPSYVISILEHWLDLYSSHITFITHVCFDHSPRRWNVLVEWLWHDYNFSSEVLSLPVFEHAKYIFFTMLGWREAQPYNY